MGEQKDRGIERFEVEMKSRGFSRKTQKSYSSFVNGFFRFTKKDAKDCILRI